MKVAIIMGSTTDLKIMKEAVKVLKEFKIKTHVEIISAHRDPDKMMAFAKSAAKKGFSVLIAGAGGAAHLPGMIASSTVLPVIGVPIQVGKLKGLDALLSIAQMPKGIPVATVAVDNGYNAAILALRILAYSNDSLQQKLFDFQNSQRQKVRDMNKRLKRK
jgi:phosphoribosylaminoimidazole carboxylase PurE protein